MNSKRMYFVMLSVIALMSLGLILGAHYAAGLFSQRGDKLVALKLKQQSLDTQETTLARDKQDIKKYADLEKIAKSIVPQDKDQAEAVREIVKIASSSGVSISQISFPDSTLGAASASSPTAAGSPPPSNVSSAASAAKAKLSQLTPVPKVAGVYQLPITITNTEPVPYAQFISFLRQIEQNRRTAQVTNISLQPDTKNPSLLSFSLSVSEYIKP